MSHKGKIMRGEKWYGHRDVNGNLPPGIKEDANKMKDIDYFLKISKEEAEKKEKETKSKGKK